MLHYCTHSNDNIINIQAIRNSVSTTRKLYLYSKIQYQLELMYFPKHHRQPGQSWSRRCQFTTWQHPGSSTVFRHQPLPTLDTSTCATTKSARSQLEVTSMWSTVANPEAVTAYWTRFTPINITYLPSLNLSVFPHSPPNSKEQIEKNRSIIRKCMRIWTLHSICHHWHTFCLDQNVRELLYLRRRQR